MKRSVFKQKARETPVKRPRTRANAKKLPNITKLKKKLWEECRRITLKRYPEPKCFTCERAGLEGSNCHLGHFIPSSVCSVFMRYNLDNLRFQCYSCNIHKSGNWIAFEKNLEREMGKNFPAKLKALNEATKNQRYDILWYLAKLEEYKNL
jgi:hypothetical protein